MQAITRLPQPVIARVHGIATAAGCQLVAQCDLAVASENAKFATSGINVGLFCSTPAVPLSRNVARKKAFEMLVTGDFIDAPTALAQGLVNRVVPLDQLDAAVQSLAESIKAKPADSITLGKRLFYEQAEMSLASAYDKAASVMACNFMAANTDEGVNAFMEKRKPNWS
jgi:enoyl-CoA hydratase/carnithine racemase